MDKDKKELLINSVSMVKVHDNPNIPTVLFYLSKGEVVIGSKAIATSKGNRRQLNADFKIDLGKVDPTYFATRDPKFETTKRRFPTASGEVKSAAQLTFDFISQVINYVNEWLALNGIEKAPYIIIAEPLVLEGDLASPDWLSNYRRSLERILFGKFDELNFLPEPFAVFQYYRYGFRHPSVAGRTKHNALVMDFGGGSFDVCIVETTKEGDISQTRRQSRPLAASSQAVGGFFINRMIVEELFRKHLIKDKSKLNKGVELYKRWRYDFQDLSTSAPEYRNFVHKFYESIYSVEDYKINLCKNILDWKLSSEVATSVRIPLPEDPFSSKDNFVNLPFSANELRNIFLTKVWDPHLKPTIRSTLQRGREELKGAPISVGLLSGGSANIRWLKELLLNDFVSELGDVEILQLPDYQEVVAKGLAIECARRFYAGDGDFSSVTYNRLCLILNPDSMGDQIKRFTAKEEGLANMEDKGVLLPSASILGRFIGRRMRWQVRLDRPPHRKLDYYFLRSSLNPEDRHNLHNLVEHTVFTPKDCTFDASILVELTVSKDGTARPRFIYKRGRNEEEMKAAVGKPFYLDMTYGQSSGNGGKAYIGLDFGTSNTSVSFVDERSIAFYQKRSTEKNWSDLNDLISILPYPLAEPLALYFAEGDRSKSVKRGFEFIEAALAMAAYITYLDYCVNKERGETKLFKNFTQRSAGPLWALLKDCLHKLGNKGTFSSQYMELLSPEFFKVINESINFFADYKHDKMNGTNLDILRPVQILANISQKIFGNYILGYFDQVRKLKFGKEHQGLFRQACGKPPFIKALKYQGAEDFSETELFLLNVQEGTAIPLQPLMFRDICPNHPDIEYGHFYIFDKAEKREEKLFSFKAIGSPCSCEVSSENQYRVLAELLASYKIMDPRSEVYKLGSRAIQESLDG